MSWSSKFHKDPSFGCGDFCKTILTFVWSSYFYVLETNTSELKGANTEVYLCGDYDYVANCMNDFNDHRHSPEGFDDYDDTLFTFVMKFSKLCQKSWNIKKIFIQAVFNTVSNIWRAFVFLVIAVGLFTVNLWEILNQVMGVICVKTNLEPKMH